MFTARQVLCDDEVHRLPADRLSRAAGYSERLCEAPARLDSPDLGERGRL
jgi:hypothetical protein